MTERETLALVLRYGLAAASVAVATLLRISLDPALGTRFPFATLFFAVLVTAWLGGLGPALLASGLGALAAVGWLLPPRHSAELADLETFGGLLLYLATSAGIAAIGGAMRKAQARARAEAHQSAIRGEALRVTLKSIGDAVIATDLRGRITSINPVAAELTGWTPDDALDQPLETVFRIVNEDTREPTPNPAVRALSEGRIVGLANHTLLIARDGSERPIDDSAAPIRDQDGRITGVVLVFRDVSARRRAEARLRSSEQELSDFFENANVGLHWVGPDGIILRANRAELEMLGYSSEDYVGRHIAEFHADPDAIANILARLAAGETLHGHPARLRCKDGSIKDVLINSSVLWDGGRFVHTRSFTLDVTPQSRADEAQALLAAVVESSEDAIVTKTLDGLITSWNAGAERLFGYAPGEAIGQPITMIIPPDRLEEELAIIARLRRGERIEAFETIRVTKSGALVEISLRISPVRDRTGRIIGASKVARDIGAARRAARALRESEERFRLLADNIAQFAWMADGDGWIFWYNQRWFDYTGTTLEQMEGWGWQTVHHPDHVDRVVEKIRRCFETGEVWEDTFPLRGADGRYRWFLSRAIPVRDADGRVTRWFGTNTDVTDQREAEEELRDVARRKDEFLATLAHELRNPLAPLRNSLEVLKRTHGDAARSEQAHAAMDRQLSQLERLVDDLLDVARISRDHLELRRQRIDLGSVIRQAVETCEPLARDGGLDLTVATPEEPLTLDADAVRLAQVLTNLLCNACKYTDRGGAIALSVRREGDEAVISVRDTGRGIPAEMLGRIFEMFIQGETSADRAPSGLGIGLTLVRRLVDLHGGRVEAFSEGPGRGSEFVVRLPLATEAEEPASAAQSTGPAAEPGAAGDTPSPKRHRVLVVDDNVDAAESLAALLEVLGHETALAHDGDAAIQEAESFRPDVAFLDIGLPKRNGHDVARWIREQPWGRDVLLAALTGWGQQTDRQRSHEAGFDHHLVKPVGAAELTALLGRVPRSRGQRPAP